MNGKPERRDAAAWLTRALAELALAAMLSLSGCAGGGVGERLVSSGFQVAKYDWVAGKHLFNRCHLVAYKLSGIGDEPRDLRRLCSWLFGLSGIARPARPDANAGLR